MTSLNPLTAWDALPANEREAIVGALQRIADAEGESVKWSGVDTLSVLPTVKVSDATWEGDTLLVRFAYDFAIYRFAQSGSDWTELHVHTGEATCRGGEVLSHTLERSERQFIARD